MSPQLGWTRARTYFSLVGEFSHGPLLWLTLVSPIWFPFWLLDRFRFLTSLLVLVRSRRSVFPFHFRDGDDGIRTHDPLLAGQVLSQLSYTPMSVTHRPLTLFFCFYNEHLNESRT